MRKIFLIYLVCVFNLFFILSCGDNQISNDEQEKTEFGMTLEWYDGEASFYSGKSLVPSFSPPAGINEIVISISGSDMPTLIDTFPISLGQAVFPSIPIGNDRSIYAEAISSNKTILYKGYNYNVAFYPNITTYVTVKMFKNITAAPEIISIEMEDTYSVQINWSEVDKADTYQLVKTIYDDFSDSKVIYEDTGLIHSFVYEDTGTFLFKIRGLRSIATTDNNLGISNYDIIVYGPWSNVSYITIGDSSTAEIGFDWEDDETEDTTPEENNNDEQDTTLNYTTNLGNDVLLYMVSIPYGSFNMGSPAGVGYSNEQPQHIVTVDEFFISQFPITQAQYQQVSETNPSHYSGINRPVEKVSWWDSIKFCNKLSIQQDLTPVYMYAGDTNPDNWSSNFNNALITYNTLSNGYRLPTEAEWEYAARAGSTTTYYWGDAINLDYLWYSYNSASQTHYVGLKLPNAWDLYDILGNVWEWTNDWYSANTYTADARINPLGPISGTERVIRGGSWNHSADLCRVAGRSYFEPGIKYYYLGFRIVRSNY